MAEDWRVMTVITSEEQVGEVLAALQERDVQLELRDELGGRIAVSHDGPSVFIYADTRRAADAATRVLRDVLDEVGTTAEPHLTRWHPIEERWEEPSVPLPQTEEARRAERDRVDADDDAISVATGVAQWEVRIELSSHADAERLAEELEENGRSVVRRAGFLIVGANDRDDAEVLAAELKSRGRVHVDPSSGAAWQLMPRNPFAVFGGLGG